MKWAIVRHMGLAWLITMPATAVLAAAALVVWRWWREAGAMVPAETPDVVGLLRDQVAVTVEGMDAFAGWAAGNTAAADTVRDREHRADEAKRDVRLALQVAL